MTNKRLGTPTLQVINIKEVTLRIILTLKPEENKNYTIAIKLIYLMTNVLIPTPIYTLSLSLSSYNKRKRKRRNGMLLQLHRIVQSKLKKKCFLIKNKSSNASISSTLNLLGEGRSAMTAEGQSYTKARVS